MRSNTNSSEFVEGLVPFEIKYSLEFGDSLVPFEVTNQRLKQNIENNNNKNTKLNREKKTAVKFVMISDPDQPFTF